jgi:hypothetical protein
MNGLSGPSNWLAVQNLGSNAALDSASAAPFGLTSGPAIKETSHEHQIS